MKQLIFSLLLSALALEAKADTTCTKNGDTFGRVSISFKGDGQIDVLYGMTRVIHWAFYQESSTLSTRLGKQVNYTKFKELSTFKDMPQELSLKYYDWSGVPLAFTLVGLEKPVSFGAEDCFSTSP